MIPVEELLDKYVEPEPNSGCWIWIGHRKPDGYGACMRGGVKRAAYRVIYEHARGPIPDGFEADHLCRNRACVNPDHIEPVAKRINILRGTSPAAQHAAQTHCSRGHEFNAENTYVQGGLRPMRVCKLCRRIHDATRRRKRAA